MVDVGLRRTRRTDCDETLLRQRRQFHAKPLVQSHPAHVSRQNTKVETLWRHRSVINFNRDIFSSLRQFSLSLSLLHRGKMGDSRLDAEVANAPPSEATDAVFVPSDAVPEGAIKIHGVDFDTHDNDITVVELVDSMATMGFQATAISDAVRIINKMRLWRDAETGEKATIFLGYTSNLISSGLRETLRFLVQHKHVSAVVTTAGGVEEDLIKCLGPTYLGSFTDQGAALRAKGMNRIGNMIVPNSNYCAFEDWVVPILDKMLQEQEETKKTDEEFSWTPSKITARLGKEINDESSVLYWAYKNDIPIFCPALTDGSLGDMMYFHTFKASPQQLRFDPIEDLRRLNTIAVRAQHAGMIIVGGGLVKHHIANACLMRNGADEAVYINTAQEFDGSDAGARPDEAVSWGKIKATADSVKVYAEATIAFPLIVAATFARRSAE
jgi:deoxyhypusine synthase